MSESEFVTRNELSYRLENTEQRLENKMDKILSAIQILTSDIDSKFTEVNAKFKTIDTDINWLKWISIISTGFIAAAAGKILFH